MALLVCLLFLLSGASALLFETLWFRLAGLALGNSVWASSLVLSSFMAGLAIGNALAARHGGRLRRPLIAYAVLEGIIGVVGLTLVLVFPTLTRLLTPLLQPFLELPVVLNGLRLGIAFVLLLVPTTAMGMTLPVLLRVIASDRLRFGQALGLLYGWNTLGAVAGALAGEGFLIAALGVRQTGLVAMALNGLAALLALVVAARLPKEATLEPESGVTPQPRPSAQAARLLVGAFLAGATLLALEVVWFRIVLLFVRSSSLTFAVMLAVVLLGIGSGGLLAAGLLRLWPAASRSLPWLALASAWLCAQSYMSLDSVPRVSLAGLIVSPIGVLLLSLWLMLPVCVLSGILFTLFGTSLKEELGGSARTAGLLTLSNTVGAATGALVAGFLLLPRLGMERSVFLLAWAYLAIAACAWRVGARAERGRREARALLLTGGAVAVLLAAFPFGLMRNHYLPLVAHRYAGDGSQIREVREGLTETVMLLQLDRWGEPVYQRVTTNGMSMASTSVWGRRYMKLYTYLPTAIRPQPRSAALICYGIGNTAKAMVETESLESIDIVDISSSMLETSQLVFPDAASNPLNDPRVRVHIEDGRFFLQTTTKRFDIITGEPPPPKQAGIVNLYSREYFELMHGRLAEGGVASYWLPVSQLEFDEGLSIIRGFCDAFPNCSLWSSMGFEWMLVGTRGSLPAPAEEDFALQWRDPGVRSELVEIGLDSPDQLGATFIADADFLKDLTRDHPPLEDNYPHRLSAARARLDLRFVQLMEAEANRKRFEESRLIRELWPPRLHASTLPAFELQKAINDELFSMFGGPDLSVPHLHSVLTSTRLETLPLLLTGVLPDELPAAAAGEREGVEDPYLEYVLGARTLAQRRFIEAAGHFAKSDRQAQQRAPLLQALASCLGGRPEQDLAQARAELTGEPAYNSPMWAWLEQNCQPASD